jgi:hypothetical protein
MRRIQGAGFPLSRERRNVSFAAVVGVSFAVVVGQK